MGLIHQFLRLFEGSTTPLAFETEFLSIKIPTLWKLDDSGDQKGYEYHSPDERKALFLLTWQLDPSKEPGLAFLQSVKSFEKQKLLEMEGHDFKILEDKIEPLKSGLVGVLDSFDSAKKFRMKCKTVLHDLVLIQCNFHDYDCDNIVDSDLEANPIFDSLVIKSLK